MSFPAEREWKYKRRMRLFGWSAAVALLCLAASGGCYDGAALVEHARSAAQSTRLAEVELGTYLTTMPKDPETKSLTELELRLFGTVPRYRVPMVERQLKTDDYRLRHELLAAVRQASPGELAEPSLTQLRLRIEKVVNAILKDAPIERVLFYNIRVNYR